MMEFAAEWWLEIIVFALGIMIFNFIQDRKHKRLELEKRFADHLCDKHKGET